MTLFLYFFPLLLVGLMVFLLWFIFNAILPIKQKMRKEAYKQALREIEAEKRKESGN